MMKIYDKKFTAVVACLTAMAAMSVTDVVAQSETEVDCKLIEGEGYIINKISSNGRYGISSQQTDTGYSSFWYDFEKNESQVVADVDFVNIDNNGMAVGDVLDTENGLLLPVVWKNNEIKYVPYPTNYVQGACVNATSPDGSVMVGYAWTVPSDAGYDAAPVMWTLGDDGNFSYEILPVPEEDWQGLPPQQVVVWDVNEDASVLVGREVGWRGDIMMPSIWTRNSNGEYEYKVIGTGLYFDTTQEHPGHFPDFDTMVTADQATDPDLYNEQVQEWFDAVTLYEEKCAAYFTGATIRPSSFNITDNGRFFSGNVEYKEGTTVINTQALAVDTQNPDDLIVFDDNTQAYAITDDGTFFYDTADGVMVTNLLEASKDMTFADYLKDEYGVTLSDHVAEGADIISVIAASNKSCVLFTVLGDDGYQQYYIYAPGKVAVDGIADDDVVVAMRGNVLSSNVELDNVKVFATDGQVVFEGRSEGALDLSFLGDGIYVVKGITGNGVCKVIKAVVK